MFLPNVPEATFIPGATFIPESRVLWTIVCTYIWTMEYGLTTLCLSVV